jgi:hypothetical protein
LLRPSRNGPTGALDAIREYAATLDEIARRIEVGAPIRHRGR